MYGTKDIKCQSEIKNKESKTYLQGPKQSLGPVFAAVRHWDGIAASVVLGLGVVPAQRPPRIVGRRRHKYT